MKASVLDSIVTVNLLLYYQKQAVEHSVKMDTPDALSLFNGLLHKGSWVVLMKLENAHKFLNSTALRPLFSKQMHNLMVGRRPFLAPALERCRIIKRSRSLLKQWK